MKKVIDLLEQALEDLDGASFIDLDNDYINNAVFHINNALAELQSYHRWMTPEQWEAETGKPWPDDWAVYARQKEHGKWSGWIVARLNYARLGTEGIEHTIVCATEAGRPPDGWRPK